MLDRINWLGHAGFLIEGQKNIYIDPFRIRQNLPKADIIHVTHEHYDHCSAEDIMRLYREDTLVLGPVPVAEKLPYPVRIVKPKDKIKVGDIHIEIVHAYNPRKAFHTRSDHNLGFVITIEKTRIYHAGDTDLIDEMKAIKADIALLPVGGTYTMDAKEAAVAVSWIKPKVAIPMHWGSVVGSRKDAEEFKRLCKTQVMILGQE